MSTVKPVFTTHQSTLVLQSQVYWQFSYGNLLVPCSALPIKSIMLSPHIYPMSIFWNNLPSCLTVTYWVQNTGAVCAVLHLFRSGYSSSFQWHQNVLWNIKCTNTNLKDVVVLWLEHLSATSKYEQLAGGIFITAGNWTLMGLQFKISARLSAIYKNQFIRFKLDLRSEEATKTGHWQAIDSSLSRPGKSIQKHLTPWPPAASLKHSFLSRQ